MLEVEPTDQRVRAASAASEAFAEWLHSRYAPSNCHRRGTSFRAFSNLKVAQQRRDQYSNQRVD